MQNNRTHHTMANARYLICTDLDRTLLPNGTHPASPQGLAAFTRLAAHPDVDIAYVTGRHHQLVMAAITEFQIPVPDYVLGDVGSTIYQPHEGQWQLWQAWQDEIAPCWAGVSHHDLVALFADIDALQQQEADKQNDFKLSYYAPANDNPQALLQKMKARLDRRGIQASLSWSIDELEHIGLLDVMPANATKLHAINFLIEHKAYSRSNVVFSGDSGNDLPVLSSSLNATLVANAHTDVRKEAIQLARQQGNEQQLYLAKGNYAAGIIEGVLHYLPVAHNWLRPV